MFLPNPIAQGQFVRPDRFTANKDAQYHISWGRYGIYNGFDFRHTLYIDQYAVNLSFWADNQWIMKEDLEAFLKDKSGQQRNRIKVVLNKIKPLVNQYIGNASAMDITMAAKAVSTKAINRREEKLSELLFMTDVSQMVDDGMQSYMKEQMPIGNDQKETELIFNNLWQDNFITSINELLNYVKEENELDKYKKLLAFDLTLSGKCTLKYEIYNGEMVFDRVEPERHFFDRNCRKWDLSDCDFQGDYEYMSPAIIFEQYQGITQEQREAIEHQCRSQENQQWTNGNKVPVYTVYFRDTEAYDYGYVYDEFGYPYLTRVNFVFEGEKEPRYTDKNLIPEKDLNEYQKKVLMGKNKKRIYVDLLRFIKFIPNEIISVRDEKNKLTDIVLDYGIMPYQDTELEKISNVKYPYKSGCWVFVNGYTYSPITSLINPQRMINRYLSVQENLISNTKPSNLAYDKNMLDEGGEKELLNDTWQGKPIGINAKGRGIHNAITNIAGGLDAGIGAYNTLADSMATNMGSMIGVNESLTGESIGQHQLVGVTELQQQRASIIQEPFYTAIIDVFQQISQAVCNVGKRLYIDNERELAIMVGDTMAKTIKLSKDMKNEDFRAFITRVPNKQAQIAEADAFILQLQQAGLLTEERAAGLFGRSTKEEVANAWRENAKEKVLIEKQQAQAQAEVLAQQEQQMKDKLAAEREAQALKEDVAIQQQDKMLEHDLDKEVVKGVMKAQPQQV